MTVENTDGFKCKTCQMVCESEAHLVKHDRQHHRGSLLLFRCEVPTCQVDFQSKNRLQRHLERVHHHLGKAKKCSNCDKEFLKKSALKEHAIACQGKENISDHPGDKEKSTAGIEVKQEPIDIKQEIKVENQVDDDAFDYSELLKVDHDHDHEESMDNDIVVKLEEQIPEIKCLLCNMSFGKQILLEMHMNYVHEAPTDENLNDMEDQGQDQAISEQLEQMISSKDDDVNFICKTCDKDFGNTELLNLHNVLVHNL